MSGRSNRLIKSKVIVTEGIDDQRFFNAFVEFLKLSDVQILPVGGKNNFTNELSNLVSQSAFASVSSLLIIRDADDKPRSAFDSVCNSLFSNGLPRPSHPWTWVETDNPKGDPLYASKMRIAVLILPGAEEIGALEEVVLRTVEADPMLTPARNLVNETTEKLPIQTNPPTEKRACPPPHRRGKATMHAFLATFEEPDKRFGEASLAGYWDFGHQTLHPIADILRAM